MAIDYLSIPASSVDPELLKDVPSWLRSLCLHKYTACFEGMTWQEMVELDEATLEAKGVVALGARRRLIKMFDNVKQKMGLAPPKTEDSAPTAD
ncbi:SAM domain-containing protein [Mycena chlorophos]|uniref:SAM domain-containing protein n=1 Tax=Mycena chlorophos TaxID=658473 RepID=A0A8H6SFV5_MYCCL|nr:SAM domain-containing protein [Mycena chlorophos]